MSLGSILYTILIKPLELLFEVIFYIAYVNPTHNILLAIVILSFTVNLLVLPLYYRADIIQKNEALKKKSMQKWEKHIKKTFKGDEQFMMLQTYYRQNGYKPYQTINGALPLLLEIPFFIAAYHFLSNLNTIKGIGFWLIKDLSAPDGLINISGISINIIPIIMTIVNIVSLEVYGNDLGTKKKFQMYGMALIFMAILYNSPAILTIYWTLNNTFSLIKNLVYRVIDIVKAKKDTQKVQESEDLELKEQEPNEQEKEVIDNKNRTGLLALFFLTAFFCVSYVGLYVPSKIIGSAPEDFFEKSLSNNPSGYILYNAMLYLGIFVIWASVLYYLSNPKVRYFIVEILLIISFINVFDYSIMNSQGGMSKYFTYNSFTLPTAAQIFQNIIIILGVSIVIHFALAKKKKILYYPLIAGLLMLSIVSLSKIYKINKIFDEKTEMMEKYSDSTEIHLSKNGKNVIVVMMDMMVSQYIPYYFNEKPELLEKFSGFTYYPNTVSFGVSTNSGSPGLYGGYDYIPQESNKRTDMLLKDKQNEALKVMPVLFQNNGFKVRVSDPTYANYDWIPDLSIYSNYPEIVTTLSMGKIENDELFNDYYNAVQACERNLFFNSLLNVSPVFLESFIYQNGQYFNPNRNYGISYQEKNGNHFAAGINDEFYFSYNVLDRMDDMTIVESNADNNFFMMSNDATHSPCFLQEPDYEPELLVDNTTYDEEFSERTDVYGNTLEIFKDRGDDKDNIRIRDYQVGMATMIKFGEWMEYLKKMGVYDNTRIIIVSDHSSEEWFDEDFMYYLTYEDGDPFLSDLFRFQCTLLYKDFNSQDFVFSDDFMTNADVPALATDGLVEKKVNPFTGNEISMDYKNKNKLQLNWTTNWSTYTNNGYTYEPEHWFSVHDNIFDKNNWEYLGYY